MDRSFVLKGLPIHGHEFTTTIAAADAAEKRTLQASLTNEFGVDYAGGMELETIQHLSVKPARVVKVYNRPQWHCNRILAPGLGETDEIFHLQERVPVGFTEKGNPEAGVQALDDLISSFDPQNSALLAAAFLGSPVIAKLWPDERFAAFVLGQTGTMKTTFCQLMNCLYGQKYAQEINLSRWSGATANALMAMAASTGPFPFVIDNYKSYTNKDPAVMEKLLHSLIEGGEKARLNKNSDMRHSDEYLCTPIITGENFPGNDAATRARLVMFNWTGPEDLEKITEAQKHITDINALGAAWCNWLSSDEGKEQLNIAADKFDETRSYYLKDLKDAVNAGRLATNAAVLNLVMDLLLTWDVTAAFAEKYAHGFKEGLEKHILAGRGEIAEGLDCEKFISWLRADVMVGHHCIEGYPVHTGSQYHQPEIVGYLRPPDRKDADQKDRLLILPEVLTSILLPAWQNATNGVRADAKSLINQLIQRQYLLPAADGRITPTKFVNESIAASTCLTLTRCWAASRI